MWKLPQINYSPEGGVAVGGSPPPSPESLAQTPEPAATPPTEAAPSDIPKTIATEKADAAPAAAPVEPWSPEGWTPPEGFQKDDEALGKFAELAKESGISKDTGNKLLSLYQEMTKSASEKISQHFVETQKEWVASVKADPELGGQNLPAVQQAVSKALDKFGDPGVRQALDLTGAGNNPAIIRTLYRMATALSEGGHVAGSGPVPQEKRSPAEAMYGHLRA